MLSLPKFHRVPSPFPSTLRIPSPFHQDTTDSRSDSGIVVSPSRTRDIHINEPWSGYRWDPETQTFQPSDVLYRRAAWLYTHRDSLHPEEVTSALNLETKGIVAPTPGLRSPSSSQARNAENEPFEASEAAEPHLQRARTIQHGQAPGTPEPRLKRAQTHPKSQRPDRTKASTPAHGATQQRAVTPRGTIPKARRTGVKSSEPRTGLPTSTLILSAQTPPLTSTPKRSLRRHARTDKPAGPRSKIPAPRTPEPHTGRSETTLTPPDPGPKTNTSLAPDPIQADSSKTPPLHKADHAPETTNRSSPSRAALPSSNISLTDNTASPSENMANLTADEVEVMATRDEPDRKTSTDTVFYDAPESTTGTVFYEASTEGTAATVFYDALTGATGPPGQSVIDRESQDEIKAPPADSNTVACDTTHLAETKIPRATPVNKTHAKTTRAHAASSPGHISKALPHTPRETSDPVYGKLFLIENHHNHPPPSREANPISTPAATPAPAAGKKHMNSNASDPSLPKPELSWWQMGIPTSHHPNIDGGLTAEQQAVVVDRIISGGIKSLDYAALWEDVGATPFQLRIALEHGRKGNLRDRLFSSTSNVARS